jgi:hypothetical protein
MSRTLSAIALVATAAGSATAAPHQHAKITNEKIVEVITPDGRTIEVKKRTLWRAPCTPGHHHGVIEPIQRAHNAVPAAIVSPRNRGAGFMLVFNVFGNVTPEALDALQQTTDYYAGIFQDNVTVELNMTFDAGAFGGTGTSFFDLPYEEYRNALIADADGDDVIPSILPAGSFPALRTPGGSVSNETMVTLTGANMQAIGMTVPSGAVADIFVNDELDFDPSDGIGVPGAFGNFSGVDILVHEAGHALGFVNVIEFGFDFATALDLQRFPEDTADNPGGFDNPGSLEQFAASPRALFVGVNVDHAYDDTQSEFPLSTADGFQASHWLETGAAGFNGRVGVMEPAIAPGENGFPDFFSQADINAFDAIGWDIGPAVPDCPADLAEPFGTLNFFDLGAFLVLFNAGDSAADFAAPFGTLNFFDLAEYLIRFNAGCP